MNDSETTLKPRSRGQRNIDWIEKNLNYPDGPLVGQRFLLADFQKDWIFKIYDNPVLTAEAIISIARKNSKTTFVAALCYLHLLGPESIPNSQLYTCAQVQRQAAVTFDIMCKMRLMSPKIKAVTRALGQPKEIHCDKRGTRYRSNSKDSSSQYGTNPSFVIFDEIGQTKGPIDDQYDAMTTGAGVQKNPLFLLISTQAAKDGDFFSLKIDSFIKDPQPDQVLILHTCPEDHPEPFSEDAMRLANPAYDIFINKDFMRKKAATAARSPKWEAAYRNYHLNQRVEVNAPFITKSVWKENSGDIENIEGKDVYIGVDLSRRSDLTGMVAMYKNSDDSYSLKPFAYLPAYGLIDKSDADRTPWDTWRKEGYLTATEGKIVDYSFAVADLKRIDAVANIVKLAVDPYNMTYFKQALLEGGFTEAWVEDKFFEFRQGFVSMSAGVEELEGMFLNGKIRHGEHPVLRECFQNVKVVEDAAENRKFEKVAPNRKKDLADCAVMAAAMIKNFKANAKTKPKASYKFISF